MPSDGSERMDALSEAILRLLRRQEDTDRRLGEIEKALGLSRPAPVAQPAPATPSPLPLFQPRRRSALRRLYRTLFHRCRIQRKHRVSKSLAWKRRLGWHGSTGSER